MRDHDAAIRREARARERQHERELEWQRRGRERAEAAAADSSPPGPPSRHRQPQSAAPHPTRRLRRPVRRLTPARSQVPKNPATPPSLRARERPPTGAAGRTGTGGSRAAPLCLPFGKEARGTTVTAASGSRDRTPADQRQLFSPVAEDAIGRFEDPPGAV